MNQEQKQKILSVLRANKVAVLATHLDMESAPESAAVVFSESDDLEIFFGSDSNRRKNYNLKKNPKVSLVVGWDFLEMKTLQIEGIAKIISDTEEIERIQNIHYLKNTQSLSYKKNPIREYIKITPYWIRYSCVKHKPYEVWEVSL